MPTETPTPPDTTTTTDVPTDLKTIHESPQNPAKLLPPPEARTREELREQAAKFLETSSVKNAPWEQKKEFLLEKGLTGEEVEALAEEMERVQREKMEEATVTKEEVGAVLQKGKGKGKESVRSTFFFLLKKLAVMMMLTVTIIARGTTSFCNGNKAQRRR